MEFVNNVLLGLFWMEIHVLKYKDLAVSKEKVRNAWTALMGIGTEMESASRNWHHAWLIIKMELVLFVRQGFNWWWEYAAKYIPTLPQQIVNLPTNTDVQLVKMAFI